jgi:hypothetical protein
MGEIISIFSKFFSSFFLNKHLFCRLLKFGITWNDVPEDCRPVLLQATRQALISQQLCVLPALVKTVDSIQVPWREEDGIVEDNFLSVIKRFSKESERERVNGKKEIYQLLDFCLSRIDHSMLSRIFTK